MDCGAFQGSSFAQAKNFDDFAFDPKSIDAVFLTHAHLDHCGRLPLLVKRGFKGAIYCTPPTKQLAKLVLEDAEEIMDEMHRLNYTPKLFDRKDVSKTIKSMKTFDDHGALCIKDIEVQFQNAGHILGSAFITIKNSGGRTATFSGDLGNLYAPILKPTDPLPNTNILITESTYGNRIHEDPAGRWKVIKKAIIDTIKRKGVLMIPSFAIERTQELLYELNDLVEHKKIPRVDMFVDTPMGIEATEIFRAFPQYYSQRAFKQLTQGDKLFDFKGLYITKTRAQSKTINQARWPKVIIAGAGMMNGGRILHHLVRYLGDKRNTLLIIGYQAEGTLGRRLYNGDRKLMVLNEMINVKAHVEYCGCFSAHADQQMLIDWIKTAEVYPDKVYCTHGEEEAATALATRIKTQLQLAAEVPRLGQTIEL